MNRILITGATGLVGSALTRILQEKGYCPVLLARHPLTAEKAAVLGIDPAGFMVGDVGKPRLGLNGNAYAQLADHIDIIFHLAAKVDFKGRSVEAYREVNVDGTLNVIQLARDSGADLHYTSTAFICGTSPAFGEEQFDLGQQFHNCYEESKFLAEKEVRSFMAESRGRANIYRLAIILGRNPAVSRNAVFGPFFFMEAVFRMLLVGRQREQPQPLRILGNPRGHLPMLFADRTAEALAVLAEKKASGRTYHLVPQKPLINSTLARLFNQSFGREVVQWASDEDFARNPAGREEKILSKKIAAYADYLDLDVEFGRDRLETALGSASLPCPDEEEFLEAFARFLAAKEKPPQSSPVRHDQIDEYFEDFLPRFKGRQMLKNLVSLNADFWIEIDGNSVWSLQIRQGRLQSIIRDCRNGRFGYRTDPENYLRIVRAEISPQEGFFRGAVKMDGSQIEALRTASALEEFFKSFPYIPETGKDPGGKEIF